jgi:hypothetical protein
MMSNEKIRQRIKEAFQAKDAKAFSTYALMLLDRGYTTKLGERGGISFKFVGVGTGITPEARAEIARSFGPHFGKVVS